jgi:hypothetical protein
MLAVTPKTIRIGIPVFMCHRITDEALLDFAFRSDFGIRISFSDPLFSARLSA